MTLWYFLAEYLRKAGKNLFGRTGSIHRAQTARVPVIVQKRPRLLVVKRKPLCNRFFVIVRAGEQRSAVQITHAFALARVGDDVVHRAAFRTGPASRQALMEK